MQFDDRPQLALTGARRALVVLGLVMFTAHIAIAIVLGTALVADDGRVDLDALALLWFIGIASSTLTTLLVIRQADVPDVFTAAMLASITPAAVFAVTAALQTRDTSRETDIVSAMFFGITVGALTGLAVWGLSMGIARVLHLPRTDNSKREA